MIHAYDKLYLENGRRVLGRMLDFAVYDMEKDVTLFFEQFIESGFASRFEAGESSILAGKSGIELAYDVMETAGEAKAFVEPRFTADRSPEYWAGWALAYYQWETGLSFSDILAHIPMKEIVAYYSPYHEMDIRHFIEEMNRRYRQAQPETNLKKIRTMAKLSQSQLSDSSGVPIRTIQQYEQRQKNINKAQAETLMILAQALCCNPYDLIEKIPADV